MVFVSLRETKSSRGARRTHCAQCHIALASRMRACHDGGMSSFALTREQCREIDRRAIEQYGIPGLVLMENAGRGCVDVL